MSKWNVIDAYVDIFAKVHMFVTSTHFNLPKV